MGHAWLCRTLSRQSVHFSILSHSDLGQGDKEEVRSVDWSHAADLKLVTSANRHWAMFYFESDLFSVLQDRLLLVCVCGIAAIRKSGRSENCFEDPLGRTVVCVKRHLFWGPEHTYWNHICISGWTGCTESLSVHKNRVADMFFSIIKCIWTVSYELCLGAGCSRCRVTNSYWLQWAFQVPHLSVSKDQDCNSYICIVESKRSLNSSQTWCHLF